VAAPAERTNVTRIPAVFIPIHLSINNRASVVVPAVDPGSVRVEGHILIPAVDANLRYDLITVDLPRAAKRFLPHVMDGLT
jgi:hypothetical protein